MQCKQQGMPSIDDTAPALGKRIPPTIRVLDKCHHIPKDLLRVRRGSCLYDDNVVETMSLSPK